MFNPGQSNIFHNLINPSVVYLEHRHTILYFEAFSFGYVFFFSILLDHLTLNKGFKKNKVKVIYCSISIMYISKTKIVIILSEMALSLYMTGLVR